MAVEIRDPREQELTPMGDVWVMDPETGRQVAVNTSRRKVRERFARRRRGRARGGRRERCAAPGADHVVLSTEGDWLREFAHHLRRGEAALRAGAPSRAAAIARLRERRPPPPPPRPGAGGVSFGEPILLLGPRARAARRARLRRDAGAQARARRRRSPTRR